MADPDWFMNLICWWVYQLLQGIVINFFGFWFAIFGDFDWGRFTMVELGKSLAETDTFTVMGKIQPEVEKGSYGA